MDVIPEVQALADKYRCDPHDPIFGIMEAIFAVKKDLVQSTPMHSQTEELKVAWKELALGLKVDTETLGSYRAELTVLRDKTEELGQKTAQTLLASRQIRAREKLLSASIGALIMAIPWMVCVTWYERNSMEAQLNHARVQLLMHPTSQGYQVTLEGQKILRSGQTDRGVQVEFSR